MQSAESAATPELVVPPEQLVDALSCPICLQLLTDPLIAACCQNNFCRQCLKNSLRAKPECPLCRAPLTLQNTLPNRAIRNLLPKAYQQLEAPAGGFQLLHDGRRHAHRLLFCLLVTMTLCACVLVALPSAPPCSAVAQLLPSRRLASAGLWACHTPEPADEPLSRGGSPLELTTPDWGRVVVVSSDRELPPASRQPPALAEGGHLRGEAAMPGFGAAAANVQFAHDARADEDAP